MGAVLQQSEEDVLRIISTSEETILHTDAAFMGDGGPSCIGLVMRDRSGNLKAI